MKVIGQDTNGCIVIDGEGEIVKICQGVNCNSPAVLTNFIFKYEEHMGEPQSDKTEPG